MRHHPVLAVIVILATACASTPGAQPHDMSVAGHEGMAAAEDKSAAVHAAQYNPKADREKVHCGRGDVCWTSISNPTSEHLNMAAQHRKAAADHRAASQALRDAEASACAGLSDQDRDMSPFAHREDITGVEELNKTSGSPKSGMTQLAGATITFRATPGMTPQWLQRVIDCHIARNAALGHDVSEMPYCPLVPKDVTATVTATDKGFAVAVQSKDAEVAREILKRANALVGR